MIRQSSSRNQRSKGIRMKHILQICMPLAVCFWLIYQLKHSNDKRKHFEENEAELPERLPNHEVLKLGRKDLHPRDEELSANHEKNDDDELEDEETADKGEENFIETQEELERKRKEEGAADIEALIHGEEGVGGRGGDDDIDEQDQDKGEREANGDEDVVGDKDVEKDEDVVGDKDEEKGKENETDENDIEEDERQPEIDSSSDDRDESGTNKHEAREEHYKADDASSAVAHVAQTGLTEIPERNNLIYDLDVQEHGDLSNETDVRTENRLNAENVLEESTEATPPRFEDVRVQNDTSSGTVDLSLRGEGGQVLERTPDQNNTSVVLSDEKSYNTTDGLHQVDGAEHIPTSTNTTTDANVGEDEKSNSTMHRAFSASDLVIGSNRTTSVKETESFTADENEDVIQDRIDTEDDSILSSLNDDETLRDPLISEEEDNQRENLIDLDTLPEIQTEGTDSDDSATE